MRKLNTRDIIIFVMGLLLGTVLIGRGIALVITLKHRAMPSNSIADFKLIQMLGLRDIDAAVFGLPVVKHRSVDDDRQK